jgi:FKBP-type peptidyl-prolyl cis-trans isomerase
MRNLKFLFIAITLMASVVACKKGGGTVHRSGNGPQPKIGDVVFYELALYKDTTEVFSSLKAGQTAKDVISDPAKIKDPIYKFLTESLLKMKKGDSTTFELKLDTFKQKPTGLESAKAARFIVSLTNVMSENEFLATLQPQEKEAFVAQKKQMAIMERAEGLRDEMRNLQTLYDSARTVFIDRAKAVSDSAAMFAKDFNAGKLPTAVQTLPSGLKYVVLKEGNGKKVENNAFAWVQYHGCLKDGKKFDASFESGQPLVFPVGVGQVIKGWDEGLLQLKEGSTAVLFVPSNLGYGDQASGPIPAKSDLIFYIEVLKSL